MLPKFYERIKFIVSGSDLDGDDFTKKTCVLDVTEILQENQIYCYLDGDDFTKKKKKKKNFNLVYYEL
ncbi:unnamed protein product [Rhizophagus irregularis]|nr:unnamed protein product [Rhizophagus irregularis]